MLVAAFRNRGGAEEVPPNLQPGIDDQQLETKRLETGQKYAIGFAAFLAVSLPLYFLTEPARQEGFVEEFDEASIERGEHAVEEFGCYDCHGPLGSGGAASFVEARSGVAVSWAAPALNDILYKYDEDELNYWITFGRANSPMPPWGVAGGGPMNEKQVIDVVNYIRSIQIPQQQAVDKTVGEVSAQISRLDSADATVAAAIINQSQVVAEIDQAPGDLEVIEPLDKEAVDLLANADVGIDTDDDGLADSVEVRLSEISAAAVAHYRVVEPVALDPEVADAELVDEGLAALQAQVETDPILQTSIDGIEEALAADEISEDSPDTDGDGISDGGEALITGLFTEASDSTIPGTVTEISLDPANPESVSGVSDLETAQEMVGGLDSTVINLRVAVENEDRIRGQQEDGLQFLIDAQAAAEWTIDIPGVAAAMGVSEEEAERAVALYNANCARCHTAGFSAGVPYTLEAGSGSFGPALWDGRPVVQFGDAPAPDSTDPDLLIDFLINGSVAEQPYGLNGFGSGRMPAFGTVLSQEDIDLLALYLRSGNLDGVE